MTLRERIMSQLHYELPCLDPFLLTYIAQFRIPDAELFLRMIRCPNVLALRELAVQHRHLLGGSNTASSVQPAYHIQQTLKNFPMAVQSEILYMLKFVETDDSVLCAHPCIARIQAGADAAGPFAQVDSGVARGGKQCAVAADTVADQVQPAF